MSEQVILLLLLSVAGILLILAIMSFFIRITVTATIKGFFWERKVVLEHYVWQQETSYTGHPAGSRNRQKTTESYQAYELLRYETRTTVVNGSTSTTTEPVYGLVPRNRTKYIYEIQKWVKSRELQTQGDERASLRQPAYILDRSTQERVVTTQEKYLVFFQTTKGKKYKQDLLKADWIALDDRSTYVLKLNIFGQIMQHIPGTEQVADLPGQHS